MEQEHLHGANNGYQNHRIHTKEVTGIKSEQEHPSTAKDSKVCCPNCPMAFSSEGILIKHITRMHIRGHFPCKMCDNVAIDRYEYNAHEKSHSQYCPICSYITFERRTLEKHTKRMHKVNLATFLFEQKSNKPLKVKEESASQDQYSEQTMSACDSITNDKEMTSSSERGPVRIKLARKKYVCDICSCLTNNLKIHKYTKHTKRAKDKHCPSCKKAFAWKSELKIHMKNKNCKGSTNAPRKLDQQHLNGSSCLSYRVHIEELKNINLEQGDQEGKASEKMCCLKHKTKGVFAVHCPNCPKAFSTEQNLIMHMKKMHIRGKYPCKMCDNVAIDKYEYNEHMKAHFDHCPLCSFKCFGRNMLQKHTKRMHKMNLPTFLYEKKSAKTGIFEPVFQEQDGALNMHDSDLIPIDERGVVKLVKRECDICHCMTNNLKEHKYRLHFKAVHCRRCDGAFKSKSELKYHMKYQKIKCKELASTRPKQKVPRIKRTKPQGDKIQICNQCPYKTNKSTNMQRHKKMKHPNSRKTKTPSSETDTASEGEDSFQCELCKFTTHSSHNLYNHKYRVHMKTKDEQCPKCPSSFKFKSLLRYHFRDVHLKPLGNIEGRKVKENPKILPTEPEGALEVNQQDISAGIDNTGFKEVVLQYSEGGSEKEPIEVPDSDDDDEDLDEFIAVEAVETMEAVEGSEEELQNEVTLIGDKPKRTIPQMIAKALMQAEGGKLLLDEIYTYIRLKYPYFSADDKRQWKNSVRHNLTLNPCFQKVPRPITEGRGSFWRMVDGAEGKIFKKKHERNKQQQEEVVLESQLNAKNMPVAAENEEISDTAIVSSGDSGVCSESSPTTSLTTPNPVLPSNSDQASTDAPRLPEVKSSYRCQKCGFSGDTRAHVTEHVKAVHEVPGVQDVKTEALDKPDETEAQKNAEALIRAAPQNSPKDDQFKANYNQSKATPKQEPADLPGHIDSVNSQNNALIEGPFQTSFNASRPSEAKSANLCQTNSLSNITRAEAAKHVITVQGQSAKDLQVAKSIANSIKLDKTESSANKVSNMSNLKILVPNGQSNSLNSTSQQKPTSGAPGMTYRDIYDQSVASPIKLNTIKPPAVKVSNMANLKMLTPNGQSNSLHSTPQQKQTIRAPGITYRDIYEQSVASSIKSHTIEPPAREVSNMANLQTLVPNGQSNSLHSTSQQKPTSRAPGMTYRTPGMPIVKKLTSVDMGNPNCINPSSSIKPSRMKIVKMMSLKNLTASGNPNLLKPILPKPASGIRVVKLQSLKNLKSGIQPSIPSPNVTSGTQSFINLRDIGQSHSIKPALITQPSNRASNMQVLKKLIDSGQLNKIRIARSNVA